MQAPQYTALQVDQTDDLRNDDDLGRCEAIVGKRREVRGSRRARRKARRIRVAQYGIEPL